MHQLRRLLYAFKRQWGTSFDYVQILESSVNDRTGVRVVKRAIHKINGVRLPHNQARKFVQDIGYLAANKNFTYGGLNDFNTIILLLDSHDLPDNFQVDLNGYVNFDGKRYERVSFSDHMGVIYVLVVRGVEGANPYAVLTEAAYNKLQLQGTVTIELN